MLNLRFKGILISSTIFTLKNEKTGGFLFTGRQFDFNIRNCGRRCPIKGHYEVSGLKYEDKSTKWSIHSGVFFDGIQSDKEDAQWVYGEDEFPIESPAEAEL